LSLGKLFFACKRAASGKLIEGADGRRDSGGDELRSIESVSFEQRVEKSAKLCELRGLDGWARGESFVRHAHTRFSDSKDPEP
jgi:hypothetical protein